MRKPQNIPRTYNRSVMNPFYRLCILCVLCMLWLRPAGAAPTHLVDEEPVAVNELVDGTYLVDFGRVAFGNIRLMSPEDATVTVHFGEDMKNGRVNRKPMGTVRYKAATAELKGKEFVVVAPEKDGRNTRVKHSFNPPAILTPPEWGVVLPFRWLEIEGWKGELKPEQVVRQSAFASTWNDEAASFECSDEMLNQIWALCRYTIKATTFAGVYVDGDRERIPYEADAYLNQLSHYYTDNDIQMARDTIDQLMVHGTWPSEWPPHLVFMVYTDWMQTGDTDFMAHYYEALKTKLLANRKDDDGLISTNPKQMKKGDIVDWPKAERDGYVFTSRNTVVNAFHLRAVKLMAEMAHALGKNDEADAFEIDFQTSYGAFQKTFFNEQAGLYIDGVDTEHSSLHANLFPLAFGLVPEKARASMAAWLAGRGMKCSVYAAQYLMEALFEQGQGEAATALMMAEGDRSWRHMVDCGATLTWEAWDQKYKPNLDWNHAWGAAPANVLPRYILGAKPATPGWEKAQICPNLAGLSYAKGRVPTPLGPVEIHWIHGDSFKLLLSLPEGMSAQVQLPILGGSKVFHNGHPIEALQAGSRWIIFCEHSGSHTFVVK